MKTFLVIALVLLSMNIYALTNTYCTETSNGSRCTSYSDSGNSHTDYWTNTPDGGEYKSSEYDLN